MGHSDLLGSMLPADTRERELVGEIEMLRRLGFAVLMASDGEETLRHLQLAGVFV